MIVPFLVVVVSANVCGYEKLRPTGAIWVSPELRGEPHIRCNTPRRLKGGERSAVRA